MVLVKLVSVKVKHKETMSFTVIAMAPQHLRTTVGIAFLWGYTQGNAGWPKIMVGPILTHRLPKLSAYDILN